MKRRYFDLLTKKSWLTFSILLTVGLFFPESPLAQEKSGKVAILKSADIDPYNQAISAFITNLAVKPSHIQEYTLGGEPEQGQEVVEKILNSRTDLVLAVGLKAALLAKTGIREIPIIFCMVLNPKKFDLEGPNVKGISLDIPFKEQFLLLQSIIPAVNRIGVLYDPEKSEHLVKNKETQAHELGVKFFKQEVPSQKELPAALRQMLPQIEAICLLPDSTVLTEESFDFLIKETLEKHVPLMGFSLGLVKKGALVGNYINYDDVGEQAAELAKKLLNGHSLKDNKIIAPTRIRKAINLNTAHFLGLSIAPNVLKDFDERY